MDKIAQLINNGMVLLGRKIDNLSMELRNKKEPKSTMNIGIPENVAEAISSAMKEGLKGLKVPTPVINIPDQKAPVVNVPAPIVNVESAKAPIVNVPPANITVEPTAVNFPKEMEIVGMKDLLKSVNRETYSGNIFDEVNSTKPLPIIVMGKNGKQIFDFGGELTAPSTVSLKTDGYTVSTTNPLPVALTGSGSTQYSDGDVNADPTGTVAMGTDGANIYALHTDTAGDLQVDILSMTATDLDIRNLSQTQDSVLIYGSDDGGTTKRVIKTDSGGAIQVDLEVANVTEANSAAILTSVQLIDNAISGAGFNITQLGGVNISMNTGVRDTGTQRVTIATNDSVPVTFTGSTDVATQTTLASLLTSSQLIDDTIFTAGTSTFTETTSKGALSLAVRRDADTTLVDTTNEMSPLQVDARGFLKIEAFAGEVLTVLDTNSAAALTALQLIDNAISGAGFNITQFNGEAIDVGAGTEAAAIRVTLPTNGTGILAGVTTVTTVTTVSTVTTVASVTAMGVGTTGPQKAEDVAHATGDMGFAVWAIRDDTLNIRSDTEGDYEPFHTNANGALWTLDVNSAAALTALELIDNSVVVLGTAVYTEATSSGLAIGAVRRDADTTLVGTTNEWGPLQMDANGYLKVEIFDGGGTHTVDIAAGGVVSGAILSGAFAAGSISSGAVASGAVASGAFASGSISSGAIAAGAIAVGAIAAGATSIAENEDVAHTTGDRGIKVWGVANEANTVFAADNDYVPLATDTEGNIRTVGNRDSDAVDAGEPVKIGGKATDVGATIIVANNDRVNAAFLRNGVQLTLGGSHDIISKNLNITDADGAQTDAALVTVAAGTAIVVTKVSVMVDSATTATGGVAVRIGFGTANVPAADSAGIILAHPGISAGSGVVEGNGAGIIGIGATNEDLRITCEDPTGGNIDVIVTYFTILIG